MELEFLGTRANTETRSERHRMHSSLQVTHGGDHVIIDRGEDWLGRAYDLEVDAIVVTHAHPDHAWGLKEGAPCPVYATEDAWEDMRAYPIDKQLGMPLRQPVEIGSVLFEAFPLLHSTRAPAVGYRVSVGETAFFFYAPDVAWVVDRGSALAGIDLYVGDGSSLTRSLVRKPGDVIIGHAPIQTQLTWCEKEGVDRAIFTHCGSQIMDGDDEEIEAEVDELARDRGVDAALAYDGMALRLA